MMKSCNLLLLLIFTLLSISLASVLDNYCGKDWVSAANSCPLHCPSGDDKECNSLGEGYGCFLFTGCHERVQAGEFGNRDPVALEEEEEVLPIELTRYCGLDFIDAMLTCDEGKKCPNQNECTGGDVCVEKTNCDKPLVTLRSEIIFTLSGTTTQMEDEDWEVFKKVIFDIIKVTATDLNIYLETIRLQSQRSYEDSNQVEVDVLLRAKYRPPPNQKFSTIAENSINLQTDTVKANLKKVGAEAKRFYFTSDMKDISAISKENATKRPTISPTDSPTLKPTNVPSMVPSPSPSAFPTSSPSGLPSSMPTRDHIQEIVTATTNELKYIDDTAYGFLVNLRTKGDSPVVLVNGMEFYTESTEMVAFELWSRLGSFENFEGNYDGWDIVAAGMVKGAGYGQYTSIPSEAFTPVSIPGGGGESGTRAFYLTLNTKDLVIKMDQAQGNAGATDNQVMASSQDLEIYNGKAVLSYPFPNPAETWFYYSPRMFLGVVSYDRLPCKPFSLYGPVDELPCGTVAVLPTMKPTLKPTMQIVEDNVVQDEVQDDFIITRTPTLNPTNILTQLVLETSPPTMSLSPTLSTFPTTSILPTMYPSSSPVTPTRVRIIVNLHNTPDMLMNQMEQSVFSETLIEFLNDQSGKAMIISTIDVESEEMVLVTASPTSSSVTVSNSVSGNNNSTINTTSVPQEVSRNTLRHRMLREVPGVRLSLILTLASTTLPHNLLVNMAIVAIEENQRDLVDRFDRIGLDYPYFANIDKVASFSIDSATVQEETSSTIKTSVQSGDTNVNSTNRTSSVNVALLVTLFWCVLAVISVALLTKARSKLRNDNIEKEHPVETNIDPSDTSLRESILRLIPQVSDTASSFTASRRSSLTRSLRKSRTSLSSSLRDGSFNSDDSLRDDSNRRSGLRSSMRRSFTMSQILSYSSDDDEAPGRRSSFRRSGTSIRSSMRQSMTRSNSESSLENSALKRSGTSMRASMRQSITKDYTDSEDNELRRSAVRRSGTSRRPSLRRSKTESIPRSSVGRRSETSARSSSMRLSNNSANGLESSLRNSGKAMRSSMRLSLTDDDNAEGSNALNKVKARNNLARSVVFDDSQPTLIPGDNSDDEDAKKSNTIAQVENAAKEGNKAPNEVTERGRRLPRRLSQSLTVKDTMGWGITEGKSDVLRQKSDMYRPQKIKRRTANEGGARNLSGNESHMSSLRRSENRSNDGPRPRSMRRDRNPALSRSMSEVNTSQPPRKRRESGGSSDSLRRSNGPRNLRAPATNSHRSSSNVGHRGDNKLRGSVRQNNNDKNLHGSIRRSTNRKQENRPLSLSMSEVKMSHPPRKRRGNDASRDSVRRSVNLRASGTVRRSTNDPNLRGSTIRRSTTSDSLRGSIRRSSDGNDSSRSGSTRTNEYPRRAAPSRKEIV